MALDRSERRTSRAALAVLAPRVDGLLQSKSLTRGANEQRSCLARNP
jgi:hypothetical protein